MVASPRHWRVLIGVIVALMAAAYLAPLVAPQPLMDENRVLAAWPGWPARTGEVRPFVKGVDAYVADHFPVRPHLIALLNRARLFAGVSGAHRVIVGREGWLFYNDDSLLGAARGDTPLNREDIRIWLRGLAGRTQALAARDTPYLVVVPPLKETVYPQFTPAWHTGSSPDRDALLLPELAHAAGAGDVLYLHDAVAAATRKGQKTYSRHDTHWTGYGAYAGYAAMVGRLHRLGVTDPPLPLEAFTDEGPMTLDPPADLAKMLGVMSFVRVRYPHVDNPGGWARAEQRFLTDRTDWTAPRVIDTGETGRPVLLLIRDSFGQELLPFLFPHFSRIILVHGQDGMWRPDLVERFRPDAVVLEVVESGLRSTMQKAPEPTPALGARVDQLASQLFLGPPMRAPNQRLAQAFAGAKPVSACFLEGAAFDAARGQSGVMTVSGWFTPQSALQRAPHGWARIRGQGLDLTGPVAFDGRRPDVAAHFGSTGAELSGFVGEFAGRGLRKGVYEVTLYRRALAGWASCDAGRALEIH